MSPNEAKNRLDLIINKSRVDLYKPIQVAETLRNSRLHDNVDFESLETYRRISKSWRDEVTRRLLEKVCTSSAKFQDDIWNDSACHQEVMRALDNENRRTNGAVERYIYLRFQNRQETVGSVITYIYNNNRTSFRLENLLDLFIQSPGIKRSIDKAYEIVTHSLLETVVCGLEAKVTIEIPQRRREMVVEFEDLSLVLLGVSADNLVNKIDAHIYRVGVTNAADRGLDMWANFGPAVQVKHLSLNPEMVNTIVDQVESDHVVVVCKDSDRTVIETITSQIGWGQRVRGIITEINLLHWYEKCLRGRFSTELGDGLLERLQHGFLAEFPHNTRIGEFIEERSYNTISLDEVWSLPDT